MESLISVVIPAYNHSRYIGECLDSFIAQTYQNIELIIVNDGSTDNTAEVITSYADRCEERFERFVFIDKENEGVNKTLNKGLSLAEGEYVFLCASDDKVTPNAIKSLHSGFIDDPDCGLVVGNCLIMDGDGNQCYWDKKRNNVYELRSARFKSFNEFLINSRPDVNFYNGSFGSYASLLKGNYIPNGYLIRKRWIDYIGGYSEKAPLEDYYLMLQLSKCTKLKCIKSDTFFYRWHASNTIKKASSKLDFPLGLKVLSQEVEIVTEGKLEEFKPLINEFYARKMPKSLINLPGMLKVNKFKFNGKSVISFWFVGFSFELVR